MIVRGSICAHVPEPRDHQAARHALDHVVHRRRRLRALEDVVDRPWRRLRASSPAPRTASRRGSRRTPALISDNRVAGMPSPVLGVGRELRVHRVAVEIQPLVEHRLADTGLAVLCRRTRCGPRRPYARRRRSVRKPSRSATACGSRITGINAGLDRLGLLRANGLADRLFDDVLGVELRRVEVIAGEVAGAGAVGAARGDAEFRVRRSEVAPIAVGRCDRRRGCIRACETRRR